MGWTGVTRAQRIEQVMKHCLLKQEELVSGKPPTNATLVRGLVRRYGFNPQRLEEKQRELSDLIHEIVIDEFLPTTEKTKESGVGGGFTFLRLCYAKDGTIWTGDHALMEAFFVLAKATGQADFCAPREMWHVFPQKIPFIWFNPKYPPPKPEPQIILTGHDREEEEGDETKD